jgi:hypothetical protein
LALIEEVLNGGFDELIHIAVLAGGQFVLHSLFDLWGEVHIHDHSSFLILRQARNSTVLPARSLTAVPVLTIDPLSEPHKGQDPSGFA